MNTPESREQCAAQLDAAAIKAAQLSAFLGLDGFVDEIVHVVDKRFSADSFERLPTMQRFADRLAAASGMSTNIELVSQRIKLGGNGPIMANALAGFGLKVTYLGNLGHPNLHPVFHDFAKRARVVTIAEPGYTDAVEFEDGKVMLGKHGSLKDVTWANIQARFGRENFRKEFAASDFIGFLNWTMLPYMSDIWEAVQAEICPGLDGPRRTMFFDLADPEKRKPEDIARALELIGRFERHFDVVLGMNEKEACEVSKVLGLPHKPGTPECLSEMARELWRRLKVKTIVVHPVTYALAVSDDVVDLVEGPFVAKPLITTGAGDHFNAGFCLGKLLGLTNAMSVLTGVTTSGFYVRTGQSPSIPQLSEMLRDWPAK